MTNIVESSVFESGIYQLETDDPVLGGAPAFDAGLPVTGHANAQAQQLANRTKWLYDNKANSGEVLQLSGGQMVGIFKPANYTLGTLPAAESNDYGIVLVSDLTGGAFYCYSDGTDWRRLDTKDVAV